MISFIATMVVLLVVFATVLTCVAALTALARIGAWLYRRKRD